MRPLRTLLFFNFLFLFLPLPLSISSPASGVPYNFFYNQIKIRPEDFQNYIRPQINIMTEDFLYALQSLHAIPDPILIFQKNLRNIQGQMEKWKQQDCQKDPWASCYSLIKDVYQKAREMDSLLLSYQDISLFVKEDQGTGTVVFGPYLDIIEDLEEMSMINYQILHLLEGAMISYAMKRTSSLENSPELFFLIRDLRVFLDQVMFKGLPREMQNPFQDVWANFFSIINHPDRQAIHQIKVLENSLEPLNFSWNNFHTTLATGHFKKYPEVLAALVRIQNRWNSILKIILLR